MRAVAAGAAGVHQVAVGLDAEGLLAHNPGHARDLVGGLALESQGSDKGPELRRGRFARHYLLHHLGGFLGGQVMAGDHAAYGFLYHLHLKN